MLRGATEPHAAPGKEQSRDLILLGLGIGTLRNTTSTSVALFLLRAPYLLHTILLQRKQRAKDPRTRRPEDPKPRRPKDMYAVLYSIQQTAFYSSFLT